MGVWGAGLFDDDLAADVQLQWDEGIASGRAPGPLAKAIARSYANAAEDPDEGPVLFLALASLLLDHGIAEHPVLARAAEILQREAGLARWEEAGPAALAERRAVYQQLAQRLRSPVGRARTRRVRLPRVGDVLEIPLADGRFAYGHYVWCKEPNQGPLLQVFDRISPTPLALGDLDGCGPLFPPVTVGINPPVRSGRWRIIGRRPVVGFTFPLFRSGTPDKDGKVRDWSLWDGQAWTKVGSRLPARYQDLEVNVCWPAEWLEERIMTGTHPFLERLR